MSERKQQREQRAADALAALGNRTRLRIFKLLVRAGPAGTNVGTVQRMLGVPATTLAHHLGALTQAGLVGQERRGREVICTANYKAVNAVLEYVRAECCAGLDFSKAADAEAA
ncbi:MAG TPA: metalloregulator ArsR/SmtB family transcription factor [Hyphomicrobiaceae bacterium]|nr:metalloregulator ArsR/SmtB family transcription factor [Hyphomicrobiaceae bacterium]